MEFIASAPAHSAVLHSESPDPRPDAAAVAPSMVGMLGAALALSALLLGRRVAVSGHLPAPSEAPVYDLVVRLRPESARIAVIGTMTLPPAPNSRPEVALSLSELMSGLEVHVLEPAASAGPAALASHLRGAGRPGWGTVTWSIRPVHPIPAGVPVSLQLRYEGTTTRTSEIFSVGPLCAFGAGIKTAWYPEMEEEPLVASGELRGVRGTGTLAFDVPTGFVVYAPGTQSGGEQRFAFEHPIYFSFAAARYTMVRQAGATPASAFLLHPRPDIVSYLERASRILALLTREFGPYPHPEFAIAEVPPGQADSAGFDGASLEGLVLASTPYLDRPFNTAYFGHELSHQWWPNLVASKTVGGARTMMSEGLAQYGSLRAVETTEGATAAERYRRSGYPGFDDGYLPYSAVSYLRLAAAGADSILSDLPSDISRQRALVLTKGVLVWDMLSRVVGRERFRAALHEITRDFAYRRIAWEEFLSIVQRHAGRDLSRFYADWLNRAGAPEYRLSWHQESDGILRIAVTQGAPPYVASLELVAHGAGGREALRTIPVVGEETGISWPVDFRVQRIVLDPHFLVLRWAEGDREEATALVPYTRAINLIAAGRGAEAEPLLVEAVQATPQPDLFGVRFMLRYAHAELLLERQRYPDALRELRAALAEPVRRADALPRVFGLLARIGYETKDVGLVRVAADSASAADSVIGGLTGAGEEVRRLLHAMSQS